MDGPRSVSRKLDCQRVPCSFWLIKGILIHCHGSHSVSTANGRRGRAAGPCGPAAGICSEPPPRGAALCSGDTAGPLGQPVLALSDPMTPATWSWAPFVGSWVMPGSLNTPRLQHSLGARPAPHREGSRQTWVRTGHRDEGQRQLRRGSGSGLWARTLHGDP